MITKNILIFILFVISILGCKKNDTVIVDPANTTEFYIVNNSNYEILVSAETDGSLPRLIESLAMDTNERSLFYSGRAISFPVPETSFSKFTISINLNNSKTIVYSKIDNNEWIEAVKNGNKRELQLEIDETKFEL